MAPKISALGAVVVVMLALTGAVRADHAAEMRAREDFAAGRYGQALDLFAKLYAETLNPIYLRNIGRCHQKLRQPDQAIDSFRDYLAKGRTISLEERTEINGYIKEMETLRAEQAEVAKQVAAVPPASAAPAAPPPVQPIAAATEAPTGGSGGLGFAPNPATATATLIVEPERRPEESPPFYARWWFWTIVGAAVAGGVVAAVALTGGTTKPPCSYPGVNILKCQ
jgi:hypothetical protein